MKKFTFEWFNGVKKLWESGEVIADTPFMIELVGSNLKTTSACCLTRSVMEQDLI